MIKLINIYDLMKRITIQANYKYSRLKIEEFKEIGMLVRELRFKLENMDANNITDEFYIECCNLGTEYSILNKKYPQKTIISLNES